MAHCGQHILEMQLFHELKQRFPNIPDYIVTHCIKQIRGDKKECRCILEAEHWIRCKHHFSAMAGSNAPGSPSRPDKELVEKFSKLVMQTAQTTCMKVDIDQLIKRQLERKERLEKELAKEKHDLRILKESIRSMKKELRQRPPTFSEMLRLEIKHLSHECQLLTNEVDVLSSGSSVPLGETNEEFYQNIYTGQHFKRKSKQNPSRHKGSRRHEDNHWVCHVCTFRNHPLLDKCEECEMPRIPQDCESPNIRIHVTHHNYPCKVVHSWVL